MARQTQWAAAAGCWLVNWRQERPFEHENTTEFQKSTSRYVWCFFTCLGVGGDYCQHTGLGLAIIH
jgi:hypothetical protein